MATVKCKFTFNTAITAVDKTTGKFNEDTHRENVLPLRGRIMQHDGMAGSFIYRYGMEVEFLDTVTDMAMVEAAVLEAVRWAADETELFPLRGDKTPAATMDRPESQRPQHLGRLYINFKTNVVDYPVSSKTEGWCEEAFRSSVQWLAEKMTEFEGVRDYQLRLSTASVTFDTRITDRHTVEDHLLKVFRTAKENGDYFPFIGNPFDLDVRFEYSEE